MPFFMQSSPNCTEISKTVGINVRTVQRLYKKFRLKIPIDKIDARGAPKKFSAGIKRKIVQIAKENKHYSSKDIQKKLLDDDKLFL